MKKTLKVTLLVVRVLGLVSLYAVQALAASSGKPNKVVMSTDQRIIQPALESSLKFSVEALIARSASLYDHKDGTAKAGVDYLVSPRLKTSLGTMKAAISYSQDVKDESEEASSFNDIPLSVSLTSNKWQWSAPYVLTLTPYASIVLPVSKTSTKRDQLQTSISVGASFGIIPDGIAPKKNGAWSLAIALSAGQNVHTYETNIIGQVLNHYLSNQSINLGYGYKDFSFSAEFINKSRWTYNGNSKNSFEHTEEIGYGINDHLNVAIGHSNTGSALKSNSVDSNLSLVNENDSMIYVSMGLAF